MAEEQRTESEQRRDALQRVPVAVIGMASIFPKAGNLQEYWENILNKRDCIDEVPSTRWRVEDYYDPDPSAADKTYCKRGGFIPDVPFDPLEFGLPPSILEVTDITQLLGLVVAKAALADAGYAGAPSAVRERTGVILGIVGGTMQLLVPLTTRLQSPTWHRVLTSSGLSDEQACEIERKLKLAYVGWEENAFPGWLGNVIAGRIANRLDLGGVNCVVDAACASSLAAMKMAISELTEYRSDLMITGGLDLDNSIFMFMSFSKTPALSKTQTIRPFGAGADGTLLGEGLGMLVLKRLVDAELDGDRIYSVIRGIGASSDGKHKSIYAPNWQGQVQAMRNAYRAAGIAPAGVGLVEAHGTGTAAGDLSEFTALRAVFGEGPPSRPRIALGSVKSQIGHTKGAAGAAGVIKAVLALHHKILPPTLHVERPNPELNMEDSPFYLNTESRPWSRGQQPRRAGVSAFGFGGTNYHLVLEEYEAEHQRPYQLHRTCRALLACAETPAHLLEQCCALLEELGGQSGERVFAQWIEATAALVIPGDAARLGFVAASREEACALLAQAIEALAGADPEDPWEHPAGIYYRRCGLAAGAKVVALFPGQGAQYLNMGRSLANNFPQVRQIFADFDGLFGLEGAGTLSQTVYPEPGFGEAHSALHSAALQATEYAQPAIGALSLSLFALLHEAGLRVDFAVGHSFGELSALWAAGVLNAPDYLALVRARGRAMTPPSEPPHQAGAMLAVKHPAAVLQSWLAQLEGVSVANFNSPNQLVLAGGRAAVLAAQRTLEARQIRTALLPVEAAFHTPAVDYALGPFAEAIGSVELKPPTVAVYANATAEPYPDDAEGIASLLRQQIVNPVLFEASIERIYAEGGACFVEFGPRGILTGLVKDILSQRPHVAVALNPSTRGDSDRQLRTAAVQLRVVGLPLKDLSGYQRPYPVAGEGERALTIALNGRGYLSEKTRAAFEQALHSKPPTQAAPTNANRNGQHPVHSPNGAPPAPVVQGPGRTNGHAALPPSDVVQFHPKVHSMSQHPATTSAYARFFDSLDQTLSQLGKQQGETLRVHQQYLDHQAEYTMVALQLLQQHALFGGRSGMGPMLEEVAGPLLKSLERSLLHLHNHEEGTLHLHEHYLKHQVAYSQACVQLLKQQWALLAPTQPGEGMPAAAAAFWAPPAVEPAAVPQPVLTPSAPPPEPPVQTAANGSSVRASVQQVLLQVVSEKTGYPAEMLTMEMEMEADLGIDSIKRIEILAAMQEALSRLPEVKAEDLAELRTLEQIGAHWVAVAEGSAKKKSPAVLPTRLVS
jgi:polyketide-type polyunsaturated fatty acid synthase PfaA